MLSKQMIERLNQQHNRELYSAYLYLGMAAYAASAGLAGFANWFDVQFKEELTHAEKFFNYIKQQGARVRLLPIEQPPQDFSSGIDLFKSTLEHEKKVTALIKSIVDLAKKENDTQTEKFLQWFVKEQREEEENPAKVLEKFAAVEKEKDGILKIDRELANRK